MNIDDALILLIGLSALILFLVVGALVADLVLYLRDRRARRRVQNRDWRNWK